MRAISPKRHPERRITRFGRVILKGKAMQELRQQVYRRSQGFCEECGCPIGWTTMQLAHIERRSQGGSDTEENTRALCAECHHHEDGLRDPGERRQLLDNLRYYQDDICLCGEPKDVDSSLCCTCYEHMTPQMRLNIESLVGYAWSQALEDAKQYLGRFKKG